MTTQELQQVLKAYQSGTPVGEQESAQSYFSGTALKNPELPAMQTEDDIQTEESGATSSGPTEPTLFQKLRMAASSNAPVAQDYTEQALEAGFGTSRYDTAFNPSMDLEDNRAREQSAFAKIGTGLTKGAITAGATAVNTTLGTVFGIGSGLFELAFDVNGDGRGFMDTVDAGVNNWLSEQMIALQQWSEKALPNYRTSEERTEKYQQEWYKHMGTANFIGDSILKNFGFTVGAMVGGYGWTKVISKAMARKLSGDVMRGVALAANGDEVASAELQRAAQALQRGSIVRVDASKLTDNLKTVARRMNSANERLKLYGSVISAMGEGNMEGLMAKSEFLEEFIPRITRQYEQESQQLELDMLNNNAPEYVKTIVVRQLDGSLKDEKVLTELGQNVLDRQREELAQRYTELKNQAEKEGQLLAGTTFLLNLPILTVSNAIQFGRMYTGGWKTNRAANVKGGISTTGGRLVANYAGKGSKLGKSILNTFKVAGTEASEEMLQGTASSGAKQVAEYRLSSFNDAGYDPEATQSVASWFENMYTGGIDYLSDVKNWQEGALGALTGLFGIPGRRWNGGVVEAIREANEEVNASRAAADKLNQLVNSEDFQNQWRGYIRHLKYNNEMAAALDEDNQYAWHNANGKQLINDIITFADAGRLEDLSQIVDHYTRLSAEDIAGIRDAMKDSQGEEGWTKNLSDKEVAEKVQKQAESMRSAINEYKDVYEALQSRAPQGTSPDILKELVFTAMQIKAFDRRFLQMFGETMDAVDQVLIALSAMDRNGQVLTKEQAEEKYKVLRDNYESIFAGSLLPMNLPKVLQKQRDDALDALEELSAKIDPNINNAVKDMRRISEDRQKFFQKMQTLQTAEGAKQHEAEAITQEKVETAAEEAAAEEETKELKTLDDVKAQYYPKNAKERGQYVSQLMLIMDKNPAAKKFVDIHDLYYRFKRYVDKYITQLPTLSGDMTVTSEMVIGSINELLRRANSVEDIINLADNMFMSKAEFEEAYKSFFGLPSETAYDSTKKFLRMMMKRYHQADTETQSRNGTPTPPVLPVPEMFTPEGRDASTPGSAAPKPEIALQHDAEARNGNKKGAAEIDYEHPEKTLYFTVTSGGYHNVKPVSEEWHFKVVDMRDEADGWHEKDGLAYYIKHIPGRGSDNYALWINGKVTKKQKEAIANYVDGLTSIEDETYRDILNILADVENELPKEVSVEFTGKGGDKRVGKFRVTRDADGTIHIKRVPTSMQVRAYIGDLFNEGIEPEDITTDSDKYASYNVDEDVTELKVEEVTARPDGTITIAGKIGKASATIDSKTGSPIKVLNVIAPEIAELLGVTDTVEAAPAVAESSDADPDSDAEDVVDNDIDADENLADAVSTENDPFPESIEREQLRSGERGRYMTPYYRTSVPEVDTGEAKGARYALDRSDWKTYGEADLSDFVKAHPEYAEVWNYLSNVGAFTYVANELNAGDEVKIVIDPSFPTYEYEPQILVTTKDKSGKRQILTVLSRQTHQYYGLSELRNRIMNEYSKFSAKHPNEVFVFGKNRVWAKRRGLVRYRRGENAEQPISEAAKHWPVVFVTRDGKLQVLRGDENALKALGNSTIDRLLYDKNRQLKKPGRLYLLMPLGDGHSYTPVRLGVEHFNAKTKNSNSETFKKIRTSLEKVAEIVRDSVYVNANAESMTEEQLQEDIARHLEECNKALHAELKNLRAQLDIHDWFFSIENLDNVGIALRINNGEESVVRRPDQMTNSWLMNFIADKNLSLDVRSPRADVQDERVPLASLKARVNTLVNENLITSDADTTHPVGVDFYINAWDDEAGKFRPLTASQMAISERIDSEQQAAENPVEDPEVDSEEEFDDTEEPIQPAEMGTVEEQIHREREAQQAAIDEALRVLSSSITANSMSVQLVQDLAKVLGKSVGDTLDVLGVTQTSTDGNYVVKLDSDKYRIDTPLHEYTHVWSTYLRHVNPKEWENIKGLLDSVSGLKESIQELQPDLTGDALYDEMLAEYSGKHGAERLRDEAERIAREEGKTVDESAKALSFLHGIREALKRFWKGVADILGIHFTTAEEVADRILYDWARGFNLNEAMRQLNTYNSRIDESSNTDDDLDVDDDEAVRLQIGRKRKDDMRAKLHTKLSTATDLQVEKTIEEIEKLGESRKSGGDPKIEKAAFTWVMKGTVILPEDAAKVRQAVDIADKKGVDAQSYNSPMEIINQFAESVKGERINPDTVSTLSNKKVLPDGITVYDVEESEESRKNMRVIINTHFGKDCSPWCLLQGDGNGNLTEYSINYWNHYNKYPKRVAFKDGKLLAFFASDNAPVWWTREDKPFPGIPILQKLDDGSIAYRVMDAETGKVSDKLYDHHRGNRFNGMYESWDENGIRKERTEYKDGKLNGVRELYHTDGAIYLSEHYENGVLTGDRIWYSHDGRDHTVTKYKAGKKDGTSEEYLGKRLYGRVYYKDNIQLRSEYYNKKGEMIQLVTYGKEHTAHIETFVHGQLASEDFLENNKLVLRKHYAVGSNTYSSVTPYAVINGKSVIHGTVTRYYGNTGKVWSRMQYINGRLNGLSQTFAEDGTLSKEAAFRFGEKLGYSIEYGNDGSMKEIRWYSMPGHLAKVFTNPSEAVDTTEMPGVVAKQVEIEYFKKVPFSGLFKETQEALLAKGYTQQEYDTFSEYFKEKILQCL